MVAEKFYLTPEALQRFEQEHEQLKKLRAAKMEDEVPGIMHSEEVNPEYLSFQEDLELLESRLAELEAVLKNAEPLKAPPKQQQHLVDLGATVIVLVGGRKDEFMIVESLEANPSVGKISNRSPVGAALVGKKKGDEVKISSPITVTYTIKEIKYEL